MDCKFKVVPMRQQAAAAAATAAATVAASIGGPASSNGVQQQQYYYHHTHPPPHHRHNHSGVGGATSHTASQQQQQQHQHHQRPHQSAASVDTLGTSGTTTSSHTHSQHTVSSEVVEGAVSGSGGGLVIEQGEGGGGSHLHQHISRRGGGGGQHHQHGQRQQQVVYQQQHHHHHHLVARSRSSSGGRGRASSAHASISRTAQQQSDLNTTQQQRSASASSLQRRNRAATCRECIRQQQQQQHTRQPPVTPRQQQQHRATYHTHSHQVICCRNSQCSLSDATHYICHRRQGGGGSRAGSAAGSNLDVDDDDDDDVDIDDDAACLVASDGMDDVDDDDELAADGDDEASLRALLISLQKQVSVMSMNLSAKLDQLQHGGGVDRQLETTVALREIRTQLQVLTRSVESCQSEVSEVKRDMVAIKHELDTVQQVKEEIEELREYVDRLEEHTHRRKLRLLEQGLTFFLTYAIFAAVLGMLQFGYNTGVINAPRQNIVYFMKDSYKERYGEEISDEAVDTLYSLAVGIFAIGGMLGGFMGGAVADRFGRKGGLLLNNVLGVTGGGLMWFTKAMGSYEMLFAGRFIIGVNCGLNTSLVPMYVSEIAPLNLRGGLGTVNQLAATVGLLLSQVLGIEQILGDNDGWPLLLGFAVCPALLQLVLLPICPESPRYLLITRQWEEEARRALRRLRASNQVEEDIEEMRAEERAQRAEASISMMELICSPTLRAPLIIGIVMQLSQQLSGINAVLYYSTSLFTSSGLTDESAKFATIGIGAIMVGMTLVSIPLMDRTGRRTLHLYGLGGMFIFSIFITISFLIKEFFNYVQEMIDWMSYLSVVSTLSFVVFFAVGPGSIPWMITAELFSQGPRPAAMSIAVLVNWMANVVVGSGFPTMKNALENYTFLPFSVFLAIFWIFTYKKVPETKNKTFEEILAIFRHGNGRSMLNCVNSLDPHLPLAEQAGLVSEAEKTQQQESLRCSRSLSLARQLTLAEQGSVRSPSNCSYGGGNSSSYLLNRHGSTYRLRSQSAHDALRSLYYDYHQPRAHRSNQNTPLSVCRSNHQRLSLHQQYAASAAGSEHSSRSRDSQDSRDSRERDRDQHDGDAIATETSEHQPPPPQHHRRSTGDSSPESSRCSDRSPIVGTANSNQHLLHHQQLLDDDRSVSDANSVIHNVHYPQQYQYQPTQHQPTVQYPCGVMSGGGRPPPPLPPPRFPNNAV